mmetsp:Transcript_30852/g.46815  ORF Transcript_30852/g.46815 Transcript_30852/m.46815 type:complete len:250 (+) Transcript_30852:169-918(+)
MKLNNQPLPEDDIDNAKIFPQKLMEILSDASNNKAIAWLPHGKAFVILNREKLSNEVLPKYFRKTKYTSFTRKLNRWNFARVNRGSELGAYYHEFFQRGKEELCIQMYCKNDRAKFAVMSKDNQDPQIDTTKAKLNQVGNIQELSTMLPKVISSDLLPASISKIVPQAGNIALQTKGLIMNQKNQQQQHLLQASLLQNHLLQLQAQSLPVIQQQQLSPEAALLQMQIQQLQLVQQKRNLIRCRPSASAA